MGNDRLGSRFCLRCLRAWSSAAAPLDGRCPFCQRALVAGPVAPKGFAVLTRA
jgi:hypothetical protein